MSKYLQAAIAKRVLDILGIFSKDMPDIRNEFYSISKNIWAGRIPIEDDNDVIFLYSEKNDNKYMLTKFSSTNIKSNWFCIISMSDDEDPDLNKIYSTIEIDKSLKFIDISNMELANLFKGFELIRQYTPFWAKYEPSKEFLEVLSKFVGSIEVE
jgi:hypothetical protein